MRKIPRYQIANELRLRGYTPEEIGVKLGIGTDSVRAYLSRARRRGQPANYPSTRELHHTLEPEVRDWLLSITPEGALISDTIRAIIIDAYIEETST